MEVYVTKQGLVANLVFNSSAIIRMDDRFENGEVRSDKDSSNRRAKDARARTRQRRHEVEGQ
jgi:hypothetical protein